MHTHTWGVKHYFIHVGSTHPCECTVINAVILAGRLALFRRESDAYYYLGGNQTEELLEEVCFLTLEALASTINNLASRRGLQAGSLEYYRDEYHDQK